MLILTTALPQFVIGISIPSPTRPPPLPPPPSYPHLADTALPFSFFPMPLTWEQKTIKIASFTQTYPGYMYNVLSMVWGLTRGPRISGVESHRQISADRVLFNDSGDKDYRSKDWSLWNIEWDGRWLRGVSVNIDRLGVGTFEWRESFL